MKKLAAVTPTILLLIGVAFGMFLPGLKKEAQGSMIAYSIISLGIYSFFSIFIYGMALAVRGEKEVNFSAKLFLGYMVSVLILVICIALFLMTHN